LMPTAWCVIPSQIIIPQAQLEHNSFSFMRQGNRPLPTQIACAAVRLE
jgi:hypothetical protein